MTEVRTLGDLVDCLGAFTTSDLPSVAVETPLRVRTNLDRDVVRVTAATENGALVLDVTLGTIEASPEETVAGLREEISGAPV